MFKPIELRERLIEGVGLLIIGVMIGIFAGFKLYTPRPVTQERYAAAVVQHDGSIIVEKKPDAQAKPAQEIPKGATVERIVKLTVKAKPISRNSTITSASSKWSEIDHIPDTAKMVDCPPVTVDLSLVKLADDTRRVVASSPDGDIVGAVDIPVEAAKPPPKVLSWAAGISYSSDKRGGAWIERDLGPFRAGVAVSQNESGPIEMVRFGLRF